MARHRFKLIALVIIVLVVIARSIPNMFYKNSGASISIGTPANGSLQNAYQLEYQANNYQYFSFISYYLSGNAYVNSRLYKTLLMSYEICKKACPGIDFKIMECSDKNGGEIMLHRTHRNGLSVDFMTPLQENNQQVKIYDQIGLWHYLLSFDSDGKLRIEKDVVIDFETIGRHILALDDAARMNGLVIDKVILKLDLKDDLFKTPAGKEIKRRRIYFAKHLTNNVDQMHDDHYHVDFAIR